MTAKHIAELVCAVTALSAPIRAFPAPTAVPDAPSKVVACLATTEICATLAKESIGRALPKRGYRWGGEDIELPQSVVSQLTVAVKGKDIFVPVSAYADLGDPKAIEVKATRRGFTLVVTGGDASAGYRALLIFEGQSLVRREVRNGEFPTEAWEETKYKFNTLKN